MKSTKEAIKMEKMSLDELMKAWLKDTGTIVDANRTIATENIISNIDEHIANYKIEINLDLMVNVLNAKQSLADGFVQYDTETAIATFCDPHYTGHKLIAGLGKNSLALSASIRDSLTGSLGDLSMLNTAGENINLVMTYQKGKKAYYKLGNLVNITNLELKGSYTVTLERAG